jgi:hypothetical protein
MCCSVPTGSSQLNVRLAGAIARSAPNIVRVIENVRVVLNFSLVVHWIVAVVLPETSGLGSLHEYEIDDDAVALTDNETGVNTGSRSVGELSAQPVSVSV